MSDFFFFLFTFPGVFRVSSWFPFEGDAWQSSLFHSSHVSVLISSFRFFYRYGHVHRLADLAELVEWSL